MADGGLRQLPWRLWRRLRGLLSRRDRLIARVRAGKAARAASPDVYRDQPRLSLILLSFNHRDNAAAIAAGLRRTIADELIVCDDGSIDGAEREWQHHLSRPNDFLIRSNDVHDSRAYNRAVDLARGEIVCLLQDDDLPPDSGAWAEQALDLFDRYPRLAVLGGHQGWQLDLSAPSEKVRAREVYGYREERKWAYVRDIPFRDPASGGPFMFVQGVSIGPVFYRRAAYQALGGFNLAYSRPGEVGMLVDHELSLRAWLAGHQVALYGPVPFRRYVGGQGTVLFGRETRERNLARSFALIQQQYRDQVPAIDALAAELNQQLAAGGVESPAGAHPRPN